MNIVDFLPKYPNINQTKYSSLNPYEEDFYEAIFKKKEFYENRLEKIEEFPKEKGTLTKYQQTIARYMSSHTPYNSLLLVHSMGLGKCVLPGTIVNINNKNIPIETLWEKEPTDVNEEWLTCSSPLSTLSVQNTGKVLQLVKSKVIKLYRQKINETINKLILKNGEILFMTQAHHVLTERGWSNDFDSVKYSAVLNSGGSVQGSQIFSRGSQTRQQDLSYSEILRVEQYHYDGWVYDLEVENYHNYIANNIVTHNTCSAIGAIEQIKREESTINGALIFAKGTNLLDNFTRELVEKCTAGEYIPQNYKNLTDLMKTHRIKKKTKFYSLDTFAKFAKKLSKMNDNSIIDYYSNKVIVIDEVHNLRIKDSDDDNPEETYNQFFRFLHLVKNCKVLLLSGTPMKDSPAEIASVLNLILPVDEQLPVGQNFFAEFTTAGTDKVRFELTEEAKEQLKKAMKGRVSFLRENESTIPKEYIGSTYGKLTTFIVDPEVMSKFQTKYYLQALKTDKTEGGVYTNSEESSLFVYPDGSHGSKGFNKYIKVVKAKGGEVYRMSMELKNELTKDGKEPEQILKNVKKYSVKYFNDIKNILNTDGNCFIYSSVVKGSGCILFSLLLELFGFSRATGNEGNNDEGKRYALLTGETSSKKLRKINTRFNQPDNAQGKIIKVIVGSRAISEGYSFNNVIFEAINTPHWNYSETAQALARGIRFGSHNQLIKLGLSPVVRILQPVAIPRESKELSLDLLMYETSEDKDIAISMILRLLMQTAFDCALNYLRNRVESIDGSRECHYATCNYNCEGIDENLLNGVDEKEIDYSTYQLYYANPKVSQIRQRIEKILRENLRTDLNSIVKLLEGEFTEEEIFNTLYVVNEESKGEAFDYLRFLEIYSKSPAQKIMTLLRKLFRIGFSFSLEQIKGFINSEMDSSKNYTLFEILTALRTMIIENIPIVNKYGISCYLRENNNIYFLVMNLSIEKDIFAEYYTRNMNITTNENFSQIMDKLLTRSGPSSIREMFEIENEENFISRLKLLPSDIQRLILEASIIAERRGIDTNNKIRKAILAFYQGYLKKVDDIQISTFDNRFRCLENERNKINDWRDCEKKYIDRLIENEQEKKEKMMMENSYGIVGKYNPEKKLFCMADFEKEKEMKTKLSEKREKAGIDRRLQYSGKVCTAGGWKIPDLMKLAIKRLKIKPPEDFRKGEDRITLLKAFNKEEKLREIFTVDEVKELKDKDLRRALYWGTTKKDGGNRGIKPICDGLKDWFEQKKLLEVDNMCGVQGKRDITSTKEEKKIGYNFRLEIVDRKDEEKLKGYTKDMAKIVSDVLGIKKYRPENKDKNAIWIFVFSRKKIVAFANLDSKNNMSEIFISKSYRRQGIPQAATSMIVDYICKLRKEAPILMLEANNKDYKKLLRMYGVLGFVVSRTDDKVTYLKKDCGTN